MHNVLYKLNTDFKTEINDSTITIQEKMQNIAGIYYKTIIETKEKIIKDALTKLGWLTPEMAQALRDERDDLGLYQHNAIVRERALTSQRNNLLIQLKAVLGEFQKPEHLRDCRIFDTAQNTIAQIEICHDNT